MLVNPALEVIGHANVKDCIVFVGNDIDKIGIHYCVSKLLF